MKLIYLSPSDQTDNRYAYGNTTEAIQCRKIANACEAALKRNGFSVINNQKSNMYDRVNESNGKKADLHVCIHTNASNGTVSGTRMFTFDLKGEGYKAANTIFNVLAPLTPGKSENIKTADFYEIMYTNAPCVYIECEFHDVAAVAKWIIEHTSQIGEAIAQGICKYYGVKFKKPNSKVLVEDGIWGTNTTLYTQKLLKTIVDGIVSSQIASCKKYLPAAHTSSWEFKLFGRGSVMIEALQKHIGLRGNDIDGLAGYNTVVAMQQFLQEKGLYTGAIDGIMGELTVTAWQKYINSKF